MKSVFKLFLLTILLCCHISTVFEFSDTEKKANFKNESHTYIHTEEETEAYTVKIVKQIDDLVQFNDYCNHYSNTSEQDNLSTSPIFKAIPPPKSNRLYLYHSVFLI